MSRRVRRFELQVAGGTSEKPDGYLDKVVKYVPADVVAAWTAAVAVIKGAIGIPTIAVLLICFVAGIITTFWWTLRQTSGIGQPPAYRQSTVCAIGFIVWVLALGDLNDALGTLIGWNAAYSKLTLIGFTLVSGKL